MSPADEAAVAAGLKAEAQLVRAAFSAAGIPTSSLFPALERRALKTGRKVTGEWKTNRENRWTLVQNHPQYATEIDCRLILLRLCATLMEFDGAPTVDRSVLQLLERRLGRNIVPNSFRDELLLEPMSFAPVLEEALHPVAGASNLHIGHRDPTRIPRHTPDNVEWRTERSNLIQGSLTLPQARTYLLKMIARYFDLGEVTIVSDR